MNPSASSLERGVRCLGSVILPVYKAPESDDARTGTLIHEYLRYAIRGDIRPVEASIAARCAAIDLADIRCGGSVIRTEAAFAYNVLTEQVREIESDKERDYSSLSPAEIGGTLDLLLGSPDGTPHAIDYKTGDTLAIGAERNLQLRFAALVASWMFPASRTIKVSFCYIGHKGELRWDTAELDSLDLAETADQLRDAWHRWESARETGAAPTNPGPHCKHCPSQRACPVFARDWDALATLDGTKWVETIEREAARDEYAADAWMRLKRVESVLEHAKEVLRERAIKRAIPLPDGSVVAATTNAKGVVTVKERKRANGPAT